MATKWGENAGQACAACKHQRRKCTPGCELAPYFPSNQPARFRNAHRLFGVGNMRKILRRVDPSERAEAMRSVVYEANVRERYPVHGCLGIIHALRLRIQQTKSELELVMAELARYRQNQYSGGHLVASPAPPVAPRPATADDDENG